MSRNTLCLQKRSRKANHMKVVASPVMSTSEKRPLGPTGDPPVACLVGRHLDRNVVLTLAAIGIAPLIPNVAIFHVLHSQAVPTLSLPGLCNLVAWTLFSLVITSVVEHQAHSKMMHKQFSPRFEKTYVEHALTHHKKYIKEFVDDSPEPDEDLEAGLNVWRAPIKTSPVIAILSLMSLQAAAVFTATIMAHHLIFNAIHLEMHKPEERFFSQWPIYKYLARYHFIHHRHQNRNFNVVIPFADFLLKTYHQASRKEVRLMKSSKLY